MKISFFILATLWSLSINNVYAQDGLFSLSADSSALASAAAPMVADFNQRVNAINPQLDFKVGFVVNTTPAMVYYDPEIKKVVTSLYKDLPAGHKAFFAKYSDNETESKKFFAGFFNGFYIAHELGHGLVAAHGLHNPKAMYQEEFEANLVAMYYWNSVGKSAELEQCYRFAKAFLEKVPDPIPNGEENRIAWFNKNYWDLGAYPEKYGYFQFSQFVDIYENHPRIPIHDYLQTYLKQLGERNK